jgi:mannose-6-phosphate isomerase-like protein (cupin superfamily)
MTNRESDPSRPPPPPPIQAAGYAAEPARFPMLQVVDLAAVAAAVVEAHRNLVVSKVNGGCLRLAVFEGVFPWHRHPTSDELFLVVSGTLVIDLADGTERRLGPWQSVTIPAGMIHRTRAIGRTVNLCVEEAAAATEFVEPPVR